MLRPARFVLALIVALPACAGEITNPDLPAVVDQAEDPGGEPTAPLGAPPDFHGADDPPDGALPPITRHSGPNAPPPGTPMDPVDGDGPVHEVVFRGDTYLARELPDGYLVVDGDMVIGHVDELQPPEPGSAIYALGIPDDGKRWYTTIPYEIDPSFAAANPATADRIERALDYVEQRTPVRFVDRAYETDYVRFIESTDTGASRAEVGRKGGKQHVWIFPDHGVGTIAHEVMHSLGFRHEHQRPDRNDYVSIDTDCVKSGKGGNFSRYTDHVVFGRYDFRSIMHYGSMTFCKRTGGDTGPCVCPPMVAKPYKCSPSVCTDADGDGIYERIPSSQTMSSADVNAVYLTYARNLGGHEPDDNFAKAVAVGDFDGDGIDDLAVGAPYEAPGTDPNAGVVLLYKGTQHHGLAPWHVLSQETRAMDADGALGASLDANAAWERFGIALAVGDFNGDGIDDLAVGAPGQDLGGKLDVGAVFVYVGFDNEMGDARFGLQPWRELTQAATGFGANEAFDELGAALAAGDIDGDGFDDLVVGAPGEAPGAQPRGGFAFVYRGGAGGMAKWKGLSEAALSPLEDGERFGAAIGVADFDGDGRADIAIGAPGETRAGAAGAGAAFLFRGAAGAPEPWQPLDEAGLGSRQPDDAYGSAIATGDITGDGLADLAIGSPGTAGGRVLVYRGTAGGAYPVKNVSQAGIGANEDFDRFGTSVAIADLDLDGFGDLVVGAPGERVGGGPANAGFLFVYRGSSSTVTAWRGLDHGGLATPNTGDSLGTAVVVGRFFDLPWPTLVAGAPGAKMDGKARAGSAFLYTFQGVELEADRHLHQETQGPFAR